MAKAPRALLSICFALAANAAEPGMVNIPAGEFLRGRSHPWPDYDVKWYPNPAKDDVPARRIFVSSFDLDQTEVTNESYAAFVKATGHRPPFYWKDGNIPEGKDKYPVANVTWDEANAFCSWGGKRLPTEAEWERAARGQSEGKMYPWGDRDPTPKDARYNRLDGPGPVCVTARNDFGLCDMIGNVWEWCSDWYHRTYYETAPDRDPKGPENGLYRVLRGGSWFDVPKLFLTSSYRSWARQGERSPTIGFRCAKTAATGER